MKARLCHSRRLPHRAVRPRSTNEGCVPSWDGAGVLCGYERISGCDRVGGLASCEGAEVQVFVPGYLSPSIGGRRFLVVRDKGVRMIRPRTIGVGSRAVGVSATALLWSTRWEGIALWLVELPAATDG